MTNANTDGYRSPNRFRRTDAERQDQLLSWERSDEAFFAAGACHILAFQMLKRFPRADRDVVCLRGPEDRIRHHVYVVDGRWAFDFNGWTLESELLAVISSDASKPFERVVVSETAEEFCQAPWSRPPENYAFDPAPRADAYVDRFPSDPPDKSA